MNIESPVFDLCRHPDSRGTEVEGADGVNIITVVIQDTIRSKKERPQECPHCNAVYRGNIVGNGRCPKRATGVSGEVEVMVDRYRCRRCDSTFRDYPVGLSRSTHTEDVDRLARLLFTLGLSYQSIAEIFYSLDIAITKTTIFRSVKREKEVDQIIPQQDSADGKLIRSGDDIIFECSSTAGAKIIGSLAKDKNSLYLNLRAEGRDSPQRISIMTQIEQAVDICGFQIVRQEDLLPKPVRQVRQIDFREM